MCDGPENVLISQIGHYKQSEKRITRIEDNDMKVESRMLHSMVDIVLQQMRSNTS